MDEPAPAEVAADVAEIAAEYAAIEADEDAPTPRRVVTEDGQEVVYMRRRAVRGSLPPS